MLPWARVVTALCLGGVLSACPADKEADDGGEAPEDGGNDQPDGGRDGSLGDSGDEDGGGQPGEDGGGADGNVDLGPNTPELESASARQSGRFGADLRIDVTGTDIDGDTVALRVAVFDTDGAYVTLGDTDGDGKADPGEVQLPLAIALPATVSASSYLVLRDLYASGHVFDRAEIALVDAAGLASGKLTVSIEEQPVLAAEALCDASYVNSRCADGFACKGELPSVCQPGEAPVVSKVAYLADDLGTRILIEGTDPDLDVNRYALEFLDGEGNPVQIDTDGDLNAVPDASSFGGEAVVVWDGPKFFVRLDQGETFAEAVASVRVIVIDRGGLSSTPIDVAQTTTPVRRAGTTCDVRTFDRCQTGSLCTSANGGQSYSCTMFSAARQRACNAGLTLDPSEGTASVRGSIASPSLWDAPAGCVAGTDPNGHPEALVKLVLQQAAAKVTISTNNLYTAFDSTLYVMSKCDGTPVLAWCEDYALDREASGAELVLTDLAAGTYFVVVDSFNASLSGTTFQLDATVE